MRSRLPRAGGPIILFLTTVFATTISAPSTAQAVPCAPAPAGTVAAFDATGSGFVPVSPRRLADTRTGTGVPLGPVDAGCMVQVDLAPVAPADAIAAVLTITSDRAKATTFITAFRCGGPRPEISHLNPRKDDPIPGMAIVPLDATKRACIYTDGLTDVIVDLIGWYAPSGEPLHEITPMRVLDTRSAPRPIGLAPGRPADGMVVRIPIAGAGLSIPRSATAVTINLTVTGAATPTYATAYPCGTPPPTSTVNTLAGNDRGAPAMIGLDADGALCVFVERSADLIVDVTGWFGPDESIVTPFNPPGSTVREFASRRIADSRSNTGVWRGPFAAGETRRLNLLSTVAVGATAVQLEAIADNSKAAGYLTLFPCDTAPPTASAVNFRAGQPEASLVTIGLSSPVGGPAPVAGPTGDVCVYSSAATDVVVDVLTVFGVPSAIRGLQTTPGLDRTPLPGQPDHTVRCGAAGGPVKIDVLAAPGGIVSINQSPGLSQVSQTITMKPDEVATIAVTYPGGVQNTYIRCLPADFPPLVGVGKSPTPGWFRATTAAANPYAFILDEYGVPVWYKRTPYPVIGLWAEGANLAWRRWTGGGFPTETPPLGYELRSLDGVLTGTIEIPGEAIDWHELLTLPNGNRLVVVYPRRDLSPANKIPCTDPAGVKRTTNVIIDSDIVELDPAGNQVWRWKSDEHIDFAETQLPICFPLGGGIFGLDLVHINALDLFPNGDLLVTARHTNSVFRLDRLGGGIVWKLGGAPQSEGVPLTIVGDARGGPRGPHDGRVLPNGNITIHDNHVAAIDAVSRAVEYSIDPVTKTAAMEWSYRAGGLKSGTLGSVRRMTDGTTVIGWGTGSAPWLEQVTTDGARVFSVGASPSDVIYRAEPAPATAYSRDVLRTAAGGVVLAAP